MTRKILILILLTLNATFLFSQENKENSLTLDSCIQIALKNNYALKVYEQDKETANKRYDIQKANLRPSISLSSDYLLTDQFNDLNQDYIASANLQIYQSLWQNEKIRTAVEYSRVNAETAEVGYSINENNIIYYTIENYLKLLRDIRIRKLTNNFLQQFTITLDAAKERYRLGVSRRSDVLKAETEFSNIKYLAVQSKTSEKISRQRLLKTIAYPLDAEITPVDSFQHTHNGLEFTSLDSLVGVAKKSLPELEIIRKQIQLQELSTNIAGKDQMPEIGAIASYNWLENPLANNELFGSIGLSLRLNVFNGSKKKNQVALEKIKTEQLNLSQKEVLQSVANDIQIVQLQLKEAREKIENAMAGVKSSGETLELTREEYMQGLSSMLELIDAQYTDFIANKNLINAQADYHLTVAKLKRRTGLLTTEYKY